MAENESKDVIKKGTNLFSDGRVKKEIETNRRTHFSVQGETERHSVIFDKEKNDWSCDCRYFALTQRDCSHIFAARMSLAKKD